MNKFLRILIFIAIIYSILLVIFSIISHWVPFTPTPPAQTMTFSGQVLSYKDNLLTLVKENKNYNFIVPEKVKTVLKIYEEGKMDVPQTQREITFQELPNFLSSGRLVEISAKKEYLKTPLAMEITIIDTYRKPTPEEIKKRNELFPPRHLPTRPDFR